MAGGTLEGQLLAEMARERSDPLESLCRVLRRLLDVDDVVLSVAAPTWPLVAAATGAQARALEERQLLIGDGPTVDALTTARPVTSHRPRPDAVRPAGAGGSARPLDRVDSGEQLQLQRANRRRWPLLTSALGRPVPYAGHVAVPLPAQHGPPVGVVSCFVRSHDAAAATTTAAADALADLVEPVTHVLSLIAAAHLEHTATSPAATASGAVAGPSAASAASDATAEAREARLHVATGMVAVQVDDSPSVALVRMRTHAFVHDVSLHAVVRDVLARRLRLQP